MEYKRDQDKTLSLDEIISEIKEEKKSEALEYGGGGKPVPGNGIWKTEAFAQWKDQLAEADIEEETANAGESPVETGKKRVGGRKKKREKAAKAEQASKAEEDPGRRKPGTRKPYDCIRYEREDPADAVKYLKKKIGHTLPRLLLMLPPMVTALYLLLFESGYAPMPVLLDVRIPGILACVCLFLCICLSWETQWSGLRRLLMLQPSLDSLVFFQCAAAMTHGVWAVVLPEHSGGSNFCALACVSCFFGLRQKRNRMITVRRGLKAAMMGAMPAGVKVCSDYVGNQVAVKSHEGAEPDFSAMTRADHTEENALWFAPLLLVLVLVLGMLIAYTKQTWMLLPWYFAAISSVSLSGGLLLASAPAARKIGKQLFASGCVLVNSQCARKISKTRFAILCDSDLYPMGSMKITGMKVVSPFDMPTVVSYAAGVMVFLGGGVGKAFSDFAREQYLFPAKVKHQKFYESGGIMAEIEGHTVLVGTMLFLNRFGIPVTEGRKVRKGVFVAIDNRFAGLFSVRSEPQSQVYHAFTLLQQAGVRPVLDVLNFLTDQDSIEADFELKHDSTDYPDLNERIYGSEGDFAADEPAMALLARDGMLPFAEALLGARRLSRVTGVNLVIGILSAFLGVAAMYFLLFSGAAAATPLNGLLYTALCSLPAWVCTLFGARI